MTINWSMTNLIEHPVIVITNSRKPAARLVPEGRPALSEVRDAISELPTLRHEMANRGARPLGSKDIRDAVQKGRR